MNRVAAVCLTLAALLAAAGFTALGSVFDYPAILTGPTDRVLAVSIALVTASATASVAASVTARTATTARRSTGPR